MGSVGDSYDNALAESVIGLYKTEVIDRRGPWRHDEAVEFATLDWVDAEKSDLFDVLAHVAYALPRSLARSAFSAETCAARHSGGL